MSSPGARSLTNIEKIGVATAGLLLNIGLGEGMRMLQFPIFADTVGTIAVTLLLGRFWGVGTGVLSFLIWGVPYWFMLTQAAVALFVGFVAEKGWLRRVRYQLASGVVLGVITALVSSLQAGGAGWIDLVGGQAASNWQRLSEAAVEPIDKTLVLLLAIWLVTMLPRKFTRDWQQTSYLRINDLA